MNSIVSYLFDFKKQTREIIWFRGFIYLFLLYRVVIYSLQFKILFSNESLIYRHKQFTGIISDLAYVVTNHYSVFIGGTSVFSIGVLCLLGLFKKSNYFTNALLWLVVVNVNNLLYPTLTAGDYLLNQLLLFNIFFNPKSSINSAINYTKIALHNTALLGIKIQICLAYFMAAWFKLTDNAWLDGSAVYYTFQIPEYSNAFLSCLPLSICMILTYATILYQLLFPILIWARSAKIYLFAFGILQHLVIALGMGLVSFGIIMIICYILFLRYDSRQAN